MKAKLNKFDRIAPVYDLLGRVAFAGRIQAAQRAFSHCLPKDGHILVVGGGTGQIIDEIRKHSMARICFVEASSAMLARAKNRSATDVQFVHGTHADISINDRYDAVVLHFFLDLFSGQELPGVVEKIRSHMRPMNTWIVADFVDHKPWHRMLLQVMYRFFAVTASMTNDQLANWNEAILNGCSLVVSKEEFFFGGFIRSVCYTSDQPRVVA